ncbi:enoyl-CoA hydratase-related protein [Bdellovibrio bacteriovorus]|uniref:3-hxdroxyacyl-CoA dehydrogenase n=1 Tax=Bdellovibrio bacteriovorus TaxID=959 RepID=A0A1Z3N6K4_BDEBC|nr:enoyl-CoA hydratase-related protein [Bdellovibrio bacteriovorus]ASD63122.1 3-hxdroxyacyl-CoA dehydrogenase [Bdellovibrio bacteriovorus]
MSFYSQAFTHLSVQKKNHTLWLTLNNPEQSNAISLEMVDSLTRVLRFADFDSLVRVIVITGEGTSFCAGGDVKAMQNKTGMFAGESNELRMRYMHGIQQIPKGIEELSKPVIAMVNGPAIGAGCDLAMMCDLRIGTEKAKFGETFVKLGLVPGDGGSFFLQRVIGFSKAMQMSLTGDLVSGAEALNWGLLNYLVPVESLLAETEKLADKVAGNAPVAVQMTKKTMKMAYMNDLSTILDLAAAYQGITQRTEDHFKALEAMKEKKAPEFQGR